MNFIWEIELKMNSFIYFQKSLFIFQVEQKKEKETEQREIHKIVSIKAFPISIIINGIINNSIKVL